MTILTFESEEEARIALINVPHYCIVSCAPILTGKWRVVLLNSRKGAV